jgi:hypothetical protein
LLSFELRGLADMSVDLNIPGFGEKELARALTGDPAECRTDEDDVPKADEDVVAMAGDVWELGSHRIACGDSTDAELIAKLPAGEEWRFRLS